MRDVTTEIQVEPQPRKEGKAVRDHLVHNGEHVGYVETQGWVLTHKNYVQKYVPNRQMIHELKVYKLLDHELEALRER